MREVMATANVVGHEALEPESTMTVVLSRPELETALSAGDSVGLWFDVREDESEEAVRLNVDFPASEVQDALRRSSEDVTFTLDARSLAALYDDQEVEAHGMRGALAIAVAVAATAAPTALAAKPQVASTALKPQVARVALKPQVAHTALARMALKPQVARTAVARTALKPAVANQRLRALRLAITAAGVNTKR